MPKFYGVIGFGMTSEDPPESGIYKEQIVERKYSGDVLRKTIDYNNGDSLNDDLNISNQISIVADSFALNNTHAMHYVVFLKSKWKIKNISIEYPRLELSIGGVYNDESGPKIISPEAPEYDSGS